MKKSRLPPVIVFLVVLAGFGAFTACSSRRHHQVDADQFLAMLPPHLDSLRATEFVGVALGRAYLAHWRGDSRLGAGDHVYSVALDDLPPDIRAALQAGRNPWAPSTFGANSPELTAAERAARDAELRLPPANPVPVVVRCEPDNPPQVARDGLDNTFHADREVELPVPRDVVLVTTCSGDAQVRFPAMSLDYQVVAGQPEARWFHAATAGSFLLTVQGKTARWELTLRFVPAAEFYSPTR